MGYLEDGPRGLCTEIACATSLTKPELSLFAHGHRGLTADKVLEVLDYLARSGALTLRFQGV